MSKVSSTADDILACARSLLITGGYHGFSYADIASVVGIRKPSIHHHFPSKADLVRTLVTRYREAAEEGIGNLERTLPGPLDQLRAYVGYWKSCIGDASAPFCVCALLSRELPVLPEDVALQIRAYFRFLSGWLTGVLECGVEQGVIDLTHTPRIEAEAFMATVHGAMLSARAYGDTDIFGSNMDPQVARHQPVPKTVATRLISSIFVNDRGIFSAHGTEPKLFYATALPTIRYLMKNPASPARQVWVFLAFVCLFSLAADSLRINVDHQSPMLDRFAMWGPAFATAITCWVCGIDIRTLGWRWPRPRWLALSYLIPLLYAAPVYLLTWIFIRNSFALDNFMTSVAGSYNLANWKVFGTFAVGIPLLLTVGMISGLTWALGEEIGWRGFLFPRLMARFGFNGACLIGGLVWAVWHYPGLIWGHYNAGTNPLFAVTCFTLEVVASAFISGWLRLRSRSIWPAVFVHASHNLFVQAIFDPLTANTGLARYTTTEFGLGLAISIAIAAYLLINRSPISTIHDNSDR